MKYACGEVGRYSTYHFVDDIDCPAEVVGLEADALVAVQELLKRHRIVEIGPDDWDRVVGDGF